jgi:hypothetical protein
MLTPRESFMRRAAAVLVFLALALPGCTETVPSRVVGAGQSEPVRLPACDDGGDGGVVIDGVCL